MVCRDAKSAYGMTRRQALQIGSGLFGLSLPGALAAAAASESAANSGLSCIFLFLAGGPSHFETFDPKPDAPEGIRGIWKPTATSVPGTFICEEMPLMAKRMHHVTVIRSWIGRSGSHAAGSQHVASGIYPAAGKQFFPNFGCLVSALQGTKIPGMASHVGLPFACRYTTPTASLGPAYSAYDITDDPSASDFSIDSLTLPREHVELRQSLLAQIDNLGRLSEGSGPTMDAHNRFYEEAFATLTGGRMQKAANLHEEADDVRRRYGMNIYGQRVLLARRLIEAGCRFVTINQAVQGGPYGSAGSQTAGTWDNHSDIFSFLKTFGGTPPRGRAAHKNWTSYEGPGNLPQLDMSLSTLLDDLDERGMLDTTLVVAMGEFGRTPKINANGGRDHYPRAGSVLLAGAGVAKGAIIGATDRTGSSPATQPITPEDIAASIYSAIGLDPHTTYFPKQPRPIRISEGRVVEGLFS
ncbi:MAG: hypothetical protein CMJ48_11265 [Planctomycetaceae bacterium]|nr:hypothetical protein [Planctomycetaceae bacterium]